MFTFANKSNFDRLMRKLLILLVLILSLIGYNSDFFREFQKKQHIVSYTIEEDSIDFSANNTLCFFFEDSHILPITLEKPSSYFRLYASCRVLIIAISFKEICFKRFFKNRLLTSEIITNFCFAKRLYAGYYTYGQGKIRV